MINGHSIVHIAYLYFISSFYFCSSLLIVDIPYFLIIGKFSYYFACKINVNVINFHVTNFNTFF